VLEEKGAATQDLPAPKPIVTVGMPMFGWLWGVLYTGVWAGITDWDLMLCAAGMGRRWG
jgi:hypothetical protein